MSEKQAMLVVILLIIFSNGSMSAPTGSTANVLDKRIPTVGPFKIMTYNVFESGANPDWKEVVKEENADIIIFVETGYWDDYGNRDLLAYTAEFNGYFPNEIAYTAHTTQDVTFSTTGEAILSRFPIAQFTQIDMLTLDDGSSYYPTHDFIHAIVIIDGIEVHLIGAHLKCCDGGSNQYRREREQEGINNYMDALGAIPLIYLGDMNAVSPEDAPFGFPDYDWGQRPINMILNSSDPHAPAVHDFRDAFRYLNPNEPGYTYPSLDGRIDYIFVNSFFFDKLLNSTAGDTPSAATGSDHFSVDVWLDDLVPETSSAPATSTVSDRSTSSKASIPLLVQILFLVACFVVALKRKKSVRSPKTEK
jgi:endonuclease/exonuclease/phosphatase family metal-dependent hydrolase